LKKVETRSFSALWIGKKSRHHFNKNHKMNRANPPRKPTNHATPMKAIWGKSQRKKKKTGMKKKGRKKTAGGGRH